MELLTDIELWEIYCGSPKFGIQKKIQEGMLFNLLLFILPSFNYVIYCSQCRNNFKLVLIYNMMINITNWLYNTYFLVSVSLIIFYQTCWLNHRVGPALYNFPSFVPEFCIIYCCHLGLNTLFVQLKLCAI